MKKTFCHKAQDTRALCVQLVFRGLWGCISVPVWIEWQKVTLLSNILVDYRFTDFLENYQQTNVHPYFSSFLLIFPNNIFQQLHMPYNSSSGKYVLRLSDLFESIEQSKILTTHKLLIWLSCMKLLVFDHFCLLEWQFQIY